MDRKRIQVKTPFGMLTAEIGGDELYYPEIFVYMEKESGMELDLVCASVDMEKDELGVYLYGDTSRDEWTKKHIFTAEELNVDYEEE